MDFFSPAQRVQKINGYFKCYFGRIYFTIQYDKIPFVNPYSLKKRKLDLFTAIFTKQHKKNNPEGLFFIII